MTTWKHRSPLHLRVQDWNDGMRPHASLWAGQLPENPTLNDYCMLVWVKDLRDEIAGSTVEEISANFELLDVKATLQRAFEDTERDYSTVKFSLEATKRRFELLQTLVSK